jgi:putative phosphoesterase
MKIAVISDSHDHIENTSKVMDVISSKGCGVLIHCGDFCAPFMFKEFSKFDGDVHLCFGNTNDKVASVKVAKDVGVNLHGDIGEIEIEGKKILFVHFFQMAEAFALTGRYDAVFYGHNHTSKIEKVGDAWLVNSGSIMGRRVAPSYAIYDTDSNDVEIFSF